MYDTGGDNCCRSRKSFHGDNYSFTGPGFDKLPEKEFFYFCFLTYYFSFDLRGENLRWRETRAFEHVIEETVEIFEFSFPNLE